MLTIIDKENFSHEKFQSICNDNNLNIVSGTNYLENLDNYDLIIKSPGISFKGINIDAFKNFLSSQLELFLSFFKGTTIGVTGSKGKSTTSSLIYKLIEEQNTNTILLGNIGIPIFDYLDTLQDNTVVVLELSSHQLEYITKSPNIAILLNIFEEHLDHYNSYENYANAKYNIFKYQTKNDFAIYNIDNEIIQEILNKNNLISNQIKITFTNEEFDNNTLFIKDNKIVYKNTELYNTNDERKLLGNHNLFNIMFCLAVCNILNLNITKAISTINSFEGLPHRMEFVGKFNNVKYYNDSIATIPEATIGCVEALKEVNTLIIGGMNRQINYSKFIDFLINSNIENIVCLPDAGTYIGNEILNIQKNKNYFKNIFQVSTMEEAVTISKKVTKPNTICLLSPAAASYGFFSNFKERGELFKKLIP